MLKITWSDASDQFRTRTVIGDVEGIFRLYYFFTSPDFGIKDGSTPTHIKVTDLDGRPVDMTQGIANAWALSTSLSHVSY